MVKQAPTIGRLLTMVLFALSCFGLLLFLWLSFGGAIPLKPKGYRFQVAVPSANQLAIEADVRIAGVSVGKIVAKRRDPQGNRTIVTVELERRYAPLASDARVSQRQKTLLGEKYLELTRGTPGGPTLPENGRLGNGQVQTTVELDQVLNIFDKPTVDLFRTYQQDSGKAIAGRGSNLNDAFGDLPQFAASGTQLLKALDRQSGAVRGLVKNTGVTFGALSEREGQLRALVTNTDAVFGATARERDALAATFRIFPTFLDESKATVRNLQTFAVQAQPVLHSLRPSLRALRPTLADVRALAPDLRRFYVNLNPLITASATGLPALRDTLTGLKPVLGQLQPFLEQLNPIFQWLEYHQHTFADFLANGGGALVDTVPNQRFSFERGHYLGQFGIAGPESVVANNGNRPSQTRGNAYPDPTMLEGPEMAQRMIIANWDCSNTKSGGEFTTQKHDSSDEPSCWVKKLPGPTRFPHITAADYSKAR